MQVAKRARAKANLRSETAVPSNTDGPRPVSHPELIPLAIEDDSDPGWTRAALHKSEQRYRRLFETANDGILILDAETGKVIDANPFMTALLGYQLDHFLGKQLWEIGVFADKEANQAASAALKEEGFIRYEHLPLKTEGGDGVDVEFVSNVYDEGDGKVIQCNIWDISERRRLEVQMQRQSEVLTEANQRLAEANRRLAGVSQRKDEFMAILSHELRNPLGAIFNAVQIFRLKEEEDPVQQKAKAILNRQVGHMTHLVDDLLEVSRLSTGKVALRLERCEMRGVVERAVEVTRHEVEVHGHALSVTLPSDPIWLDADPVRLEQVVVNLLTNAIKYTDDGGQIGVTVVREGGEMVLRVRDTGIGIEADLLPRIFDVFVQAERSLLRSQGGLGIGLALVRRLVELHGGTVEARSAGLKRGCEFVVRLPVAASSTHEGATEPKSVALRVLVVDDNVDFVDGVATLLRATGHEVETAHSGRAALEATVEFHPDVAVLDIEMPGMDGYEVARRMRQDPTLRGMRVVGLSGYKQITAGPLAQGARFDDFLLKPVRFERLEASLRP